MIDRPSRLGSSFLNMLVNPCFCFANIWSRIFHNVGKQAQYGRSLVRLQPARTIDVKGTEKQHIVREKIACRLYKISTSVSSFSFLFLSTLLFSGNSVLFSRKFVQIPSAFTQFDDMDLSPSKEDRLKFLNGFGTLVSAFSCSSVARGTWVIGHGVTKKKPGCSSRKCTPTSPSISGRSR